MHEAKAPGSRIQTGVKCRTSEYADVNTALYDWYLITCSKNVYPTGPQLVEKAKQIAEQLRKSDFKGSNGWFDKWKKRFNVKQLTVNGELGDIQGITIDSWKERLPEIVEGYKRMTFGIWMKLESFGRLFLWAKGKRMQRE